MVAHMPKPFQVLSIAFVLCLAPLHALPTFTVGSGGTHASLQGAVDACPSEGCVIQLLDAEYAVPREVWIGGKKHLSIEPSPALKAAGTRPHLLAASPERLFTDAGTAANPSDPLRPAGWKRWPVSYTSGEGGALNTTNPYSTTGFQYNGLLVIDSSSDIRIEGLHIDGGSPRYFLNKGVWSGKYEVVFGNVGVNLHHSRNVVVRDCRLSNFFAGLYLNSSNKGGATATLGTSEQASTTSPASGAMGAHVVERNIFHDNWWAAYDESEWDLGSIFRFNRSIANYNVRHEELRDSTTYEGQSMFGGFLYMKDVPRAIHRIHNNTIWKSPLVVGHGYFKVGVQHLFYNNIVGGFDQLPGTLRSAVANGPQLLSRCGYWNSNDVIGLGASDTNYQIMKVGIATIVDSTLCRGFGLRSDTCYVNLEDPVPVVAGTRFANPWNGWTFRKGGLVKVTYKGVDYWHFERSLTELYPGGGFFDSADGLGTATARFALNNVRWVRTIPWKSTTPGSTGFLEPDWNDSLVLAAIKGKGRRAGWTSEPLDVGAVVTQSLDTTLIGPRSLMDVGKDGANCWRLPIRLHSRFASARVVSVKAWSYTFATSQSTSGLGSVPKVVGIASVADSTVANGSSLKVCTNSGPSLTADLRFELETEAALQGGATVRFEPAVFLATTATPVFVGTARRSATADLRISQAGRSLVAHGLVDGPLRIELRTLDGRVLAKTSTSSRDGIASIPLPEGARGPVLVRVSQGDNSWQKIALPL